MASIYIDGQAREADPKQNLLQICLSLGYDLPYFCWHPALGSVGACRQCAVKQFRNEQDKTGKLIMACMTPAAEGMRISIADPEATEFRSAVIQGLMQNHPHDCPVCDEGGECHLQDMTVMTGHRCRSYRFEKRTFRNQYLGPLVHHEMNRCIQCQRCVRYYRDYAGGHDLNAFRLRDTVYFGRHTDGVLESEFAGNLVEICPTGVFTDATLKRHYTRKWDLQMAPSVCVHCGLGCNISAGERYGSLRRIINRYNHQVNGYFLCDRGRFGYEFVESNLRIRYPQVEGKVALKAEALERLGALLKSGKTIGIGSPRASLEGNFALRELVGERNFFSGLPESESALLANMLRILREGPARSPSLDDMEECDAVFILGEDVTNVAPLMALRLRQCVRQVPMEMSRALKIPDWLDGAVRGILQDAKGPFFIATPYATRLDDIATATRHATPENLARLGFAVAHAIDGNAPAVSDLEEDLAHLAETIAVALAAAKRPLVISGASLQSQSIVEAAAQVAWSLCRTGRPASLAYTAPECNSFGLAMMEPRPLSELPLAVDGDSVQTVIALENDLFRRMPADAVRAMLGKVRLVALDHLENGTTEAAEIVLPAGTFAESAGTFVSSEGRAQRFFQVFVPGSDVQESWHWLRDAAAISGRTDLAWNSLDDLTASMAESLPLFHAIAGVAPLRKDSGKIAREPNRYSGRTAMLANISVHEPKPPDDPDSALSFSMEFGPQTVPPSLNPFFWAPGWNSIQSVNKFQSEVGGELRGHDPGVRMIEPSSASAVHYYEPLPKPFRAGPGELLLIPIFHLFGSEELSRQAYGIRQLVPEAYVALHPSDAASARISSGDRANVTIGQASLEAAVVVRDDLPRGVAGIPSGFPPFAGIPLPDRGTVQVVEAKRQRLSEPISAQATGKGAAQ